MPSILNHIYVLELYTSTTHPSHRLKSVPLKIKESVFLLKFILKCPKTFSYHQRLVPLLLSGKLCVTSLRAAITSSIKRSIAWPYEILLCKKWDYKELVWKLSYHNISLVFSFLFIIEINITNLWVIMEQFILKEQNKSLSCFWKWFFPPMFIKI